MVSKIMSERVTHTCYMAFLSATRDIDVMQEREVAAGFLNLASVALVAAQEILRDDSGDWMETVAARSECLECHLRLSSARLQLEAAMGKKGGGQ